VTVLLPAYNAGMFIRHCLESLLKSDQGCAFAVLVVNDGSTDNTLAILEEYAVKFRAREGYPIPFQILSLEHVGLAAALDLGIQITETEYVARIDADDIMLDNRLSRQVAFLDANPDVHVVGSQAIRFSDQSLQGLEAERCISMYTHPLLVGYALHYHCALLHPSVTFRKRTVVECGGYAPSTSSKNCSSSLEIYVEDYSLWMRVAERYPFSLANLPDTLIKWRSHGRGKSRLEATPAEQCSRTLQSNLWNSTLAEVSPSEQNSLVDASTIQRILKPTVHLRDAHDADQAIVLIEALESRYLQRLQHLPPQCHELSSDKMEITTNCVNEISQRYILKVLSAMQTKDSTYSIPARYRDLIRVNQSNVFKLSIVQQLLSSSASSLS
jgi:hypothetical protein